MFGQSLPGIGINLYPERSRKGSGERCLPAAELLVDVSPAAGYFARGIDADAILAADNPDQCSFGICLPAADARSLRFVPATCLFTSGHASSRSQPSPPRNCCRPGLEFPFSKFIALAATLYNHLTEFWIIFNDTCLAFLVALLNFFRLVIRFFIFDELRRALGKLLN